MRCKFCFATFKDVKHSILPKGHLPKEQSIEIVRHLSEYGFKKITFVGGEPTLCPWLPVLIQTAKRAGLITTIVTNGSELTHDFLKTNQESLDWIAVSIDSLYAQTNIETGRAITGRKPLSLEEYTSVVDRIKMYGYQLKINTVVNSKNYKQNMGEFIRHAEPEDWKLFQVLPIKGQNDLKIDDFIISDKQFQFFLNIHKELENITRIIPENNSQMTGSYVMVDPAGRFIDNTYGEYRYSEPILKVGVKLAIRGMSYDTRKFEDRGGNRHNN